MDSEALKNLKAKVIKKSFEVITKKFMLSQILRQEFLKIYKIETPLKST